LTLIHDFDLSRTYTDPWTTLPAMLLIVVLMAYACISARKRPLISFSILFFFLNHFIEGSFLALEIVYEHRNYLPSLFFFLPMALIVVSGMERFASRRAFTAVLVCFVFAVLVIQGVTVMMQNNVYHDELSLWSDNVRKAPALQRPHHNLGVVHLAAGRLSEAHHELQAALVGRDDARKDNKAYTHYYLGLYYKLIGQDDEAAPHFRRAMEMVPDYPDPYQGLAEIMIARNDYREAHRLIGRALSLTPGRSDFRLTLGMLLLEEGKIQAAIGEIVNALKSQGNPHLAYALLSKAYAMKKEESISSHFKRAAFYAV